MDALITLLEGATWRRLRAIALAHRVGFDTNQTKAQAVDLLTRLFIKEKRHVTTIKRLSRDERAALVSLKAQSGRMPAQQFMAAFGDIRPYRPWRWNAPRHPWRHPVSMAEKLWFLGLIHIVKDDKRHQWVVLPQEIAACVPDPPEPRLIPAPEGGTLPLLDDLIGFLGAIQRDRPRLLWGRWLSMKAMRAINADLAVPAVIQRSELATPKLKFLHYLAEVAGLVVVHQRRLVLTVAAWDWLGQPSEDQFRYVLDHWQRDLERQRQPRWAAYRLPPLDPVLFAAVRDILQPGQAIKADDLHHALSIRLCQPIPAIKEELAHLWAAWGDLAGMMSLKRGRVRLHALPHRGEASVTRTQDAILITAAVPPPIAVQLAGWAVRDPGGWRIDAEAVRGAVERGMGVPAILHLLHQVNGAPLSEAIADQVAAWDRSARALTLRSVTLIEAHDAETLAGLRQHPRLRWLFGTSLSPHHATVSNPAGLKQALDLRGIPYADHTPQAPASLPPDDYLHLSLAVFRSLADWATLPVHIPGALRDALPPPSEAVGCLIDATLDALRRAFQEESTAPYTRLPDPTIRAAVDAAYQDRGTVIMEYWGAADGVPQRRRVDPLTPLTDQGGVVYFDGWCHRVQTVRTFRLDRIVSVGASSPPTALP